MDANVLTTSGANADGEVAWIWRPDAGVKFSKAKQFARERRWQESPVTGMSAKETVKTIAQGRPGDSAKPVVSNSRAFYTCTRGHGCGEHPAFPAPS